MYFFILITVSGSDGYSRSTIPGGPTKIEKRDNGLLVVDEVIQSRLDDTATGNLYTVNILMIIIWPLLLSDDDSGDGLDWSGDGLDWSSGGPRTGDDSRTGRLTRKSTISPVVQRSVAQ